VGRYLEKIKRTHRTLQTNAKKPKALGALLVIVTLGVIGTIADALLDQGLWALLAWAYPHVLAWTRAPIGGVGLAFLGALFLWCFVLLTASYLEERPRRIRAPTKARLTDAERVAIDQIRGAWGISGTNAAYALVNLWEKVLYPLWERREVYFWVPLLESHHKTLIERRKEFEKRLARESGSSLTAVQEAYNGFYLAHMMMVYWLSKIIENDLIKCDAREFEAAFETWTVAYRRFLSDGRRLALAAEHEGFLVTGLGLRHEHTTDPDFVALHERINAEVISARNAGDTAPEAAES
jgi:hypothetical protein